ncbi:probable E3 ubiquitin-protein ligase HERC2 [Scaptodrosophila lebanonensis]|uniref:HECT-type E3 ubiquitin transferase n=1 Tax=Drosophila lebanonensis TaxID=7225 RepID=A0A6J2TZQ8_DROLE|nr:probable E3 ubiquitin-protein ligase HERC2 [Scaptodrosophila lebanonensis]
MYYGNYNANEGTAAATTPTGDLYLRPLPYLDAKWLRADLIACLRNSAEAAVLWNHLIQDCELVSSPAAAVMNARGQLSYLGDDGKHYCGAQKLKCICCQSDYCGPLSACNCEGCRPLDSDTAIRKLTSAAQQAATQHHGSELTLNNWLWSQPPTQQAKKECQRMLIAELHELALRAAGNCLSAQQMRQQLFIYERYFVALKRTQQQQLQQKQNLLQQQHQINKTADAPTSSGSNSTVVEKLGRRVSALPLRRDSNHTPDSSAIATAGSGYTPNEHVALGLARVGTRAALNFSFAFLRRAWRSGEDIEMCSELLSEALESLQELPEATLFDATEVSPLWLEVMERSIKFLRLVALGDPMGGRCVAPIADRHTALCLLLELGVQKGTLAATLECVVLLLLLWDKDKSSNDNRDIPKKAGAPLLPILQRYQRISAGGSMAGATVANGDLVSTTSATETFLRFLMLPKSSAAIVDLKRAAVVIISHLDRLALPHMPNCVVRGPPQQDSLRAQLGHMAQPAPPPPTPQEQQRVYVLGWPTLYREQHGFTAEPALHCSMGEMPTAADSGGYSAPLLKCKFQVKQVACSEELVLFLSQDGKLYNWRISKPELEPQLIEEIAHEHIVTIASHCEGRHFLAIDTHRNAYSWGSGESHRLGHGDCHAREFPTKIVALDHCVKAVFCGCSYSAAITNSGNLYTWGRGTYGRLGHGNSDDQCLPAIVMAVADHEIIDVALGSGDAHTLCLTAEGLVYAWGDGDYGKLGNGSCNSSLLPIIIETLPRIQRVFAGAQYSLALSVDGQLYTWGKSTCLGHHMVERNVQGYSVPKQVTALQHKRVVDVAVGVAHCLALSSGGEVYGWGWNDYQQICPSAISREPLLRAPLMITPPTVIVSGVACTAGQSLLWTQSSWQGVPLRVPFVIDLTEPTFRLLDQLLGMCCGGQDSNNRQTPNQESECIAVACLNLIRLQLVALISNGVEPKQLGLGSGSRLLASLKTRILTLAGGTNVLKTIQVAAQQALQDGWSVLLPTAAERAQTLTSLLPSELGHSSPGHRFMTDLLVSSLMAEGGLESALHHAIRLESSSVDTASDGAHHLPLLHLITRLLGNNAALTQTRLAQRRSPTLVTKHEQEPKESCSIERSSPSLNLLHRFQRLLLAHMHQASGIADEDTSGAEALLAQYLHSLVPLCVVTLQQAHELALQGRDVSDVNEVLKSDISDALLYELLMGLVLLKRDRPECLSKFRWTRVFVPLLRALDKLNHVLCESELRDGDDMGWPGIICRGGPKGGATGNIPATESEMQYVRRTDLENQLIDGGRCVILGGYVCDLTGYVNESQGLQELLAAGIGKDLTADLSAPATRCIMEHILQNHKLGKYANATSEEKHPPSSGLSLTHFNSECALAHLLGVTANLMITGPALQPAELQCKQLNKSSILSGGLLLLQPSNPFDEEKGDARSSHSTAGNTPTGHEPPPTPLQQPPVRPVRSQLQQRVDNFIGGLAEARLGDMLVAAWTALAERYCKEHNLMWHQEFPTEHPVQELERLLTAVLIRHQCLGGLVVNTLEANMQSQPPKQLSEIIRLVYQSKWSVVRTRQQLNRSYKEVCAPIIERLRFLLYEVRPTVSSQQRGLQRLPLLHRLPRFKHLVRRLLVEMRAVKKQLACAKPEDILNVTIQSQQQQHMVKQESLELLPVNGLELTTDLTTATPMALPPSATTEHVLKSSNDIFYEHEQDEKKPENEAEMDESSARLLRRINEKLHFDGELNASLMHDIVDFAMQDSCDVETVRRAMYCQMQRYQLRLGGLQLFQQLLEVHGLLDAPQYNLLNGFLGLHLKNSGGVGAHTMHVLKQLNMITAYQKANLLLAQSRIIEWAVRELRRLVNEEQLPLRGKDSCNLSAYVLLKKLPRARFLLSVFGLLAKEQGANELSLLINSGLLGTVLGLLAQTGGEGIAARSPFELTVLYEDTMLKQKSSKAHLSGPELAKLMKIGTRIVRGADWKWGDQDGNPPGEGRIISEVGEDGWVRVEWYTGATNSYRMGKEGQYDLQLADSALNIVSPTEPEHDEIHCCEPPPTSESHPTKLLRYCASKLLQIVAVGTGLHSERMDKHAVRGVTSMFRTILDPKPALALTSHCVSWLNLGFVRAIAGDCRTLSTYMSSPSWLTYYIDLLEQPATSEQLVFRQIHCVRLLQCALVHWSHQQQHMGALVRQLFATLGRLALHCPHDTTLQPHEGKARVVLTASHSGTVAEEIVTLLRRLHTLPHWNSVINSFLAQKLCVAAELFGEDSPPARPQQTQKPNQHHVQLLLDNDHVFVLGVLSTIGGYDLRPRVGLNCFHEGNHMTISSFTTRGRCLLAHNNLSGPAGGHFVKVALSSLLPNIDYSVFSLTRLPMNEMLLNAWTVLLYGPPGDAKEANSTPEAHIDLALLRAQQLHLAVLNTNSVLYRHQAALRKILKQRAPGIFQTAYNTDGSGSEEEANVATVADQPGTSAATKNKTRTTSTEIVSKLDQNNDLELLIQCILLRATQPSPVKACYSYTDLATAALNCVQSLACQTHLELSEGGGSGIQPCMSIPAQPTMVHGVPVYNIANLNSASTVSSAIAPEHINEHRALATDAQLIGQIMEMGFTRKSVELALKQLSLHPETIPTPEQIVQWILEHPDVCANTIEEPSDFHDTNDTEKPTGTGKRDADGDSDNECLSSSTSSDTVEGSSLQDTELSPNTIATVPGPTPAPDNAPIKFETRKDFQTADQYALYVRGLVCPGMTVRCCRDFEEIKKGDMGTVLIVDTEGLHDLNVQVDWRNHGSTYWVCFVHIELVEFSHDQQATTQPRPPHIGVGARVRLRPSCRFIWSMHMRIGRSTGYVTAVKGKEVTVDFLEMPGWQGHINDVELVSVPAFTSAMTSDTQLPQSSQPMPNDLIDDWSRCIRALSVSSNEAAAKHLLDGSVQVWQSSSSGQCKHWIRLEMHDHVLVHRLTLRVSPEDHSHMPSLVEVRVGECVDSLKEYTWIPIKSTATSVLLMQDVRHYFPWIEIVIKQCQNNGIQCKVHGLEIVGRRQQPDLDHMLTNAQFLACEYTGLASVGPSADGCVSPDARSTPQNELPCTVMVWGLNDKEQLGGLKGSKVKVPTFSQTISRLRPIHIAGGSKSLFVVSQDGKVYACGEGTNGRLGLGVTHNVSMPHQLHVLHQYVVKKVAVHSGGKHALALTLDGKVFSWGEGEDGKLGHGNRTTIDKPRLIEALRSKKVRDIACGSSHSAAITSLGELYTWGLGEYGRLGHGDNGTQLKPKLVTALVGRRVIQVACGSRDAQTLALTEDGAVFSWGDGDFGKLGRGGSEGSATPHEIERLTGIGVIQIECGAQFSLALTRAGEVWTWGKGDYYRLGHGGDQHVRKPQPIAGLRGRRVIHVAVGALHCLAVTDAGQVFAWGDNDHGQQGSGNTFVNKKPALVIGLDAVFVNRVACGSSHSIAWGLPNATLDDEKRGPVPFTTTRDPLGGSSLAIYEAEPLGSGGLATTGCKSDSKSTHGTITSLSESLVLETPAARQTALNYVLKAMSILQARQLIVAALTSHSKVNYNEKQTHEFEVDHASTTAVGSLKELVAPTGEMIAQGGGEAPADATDPALQEVSPDGLDTAIPPPPSTCPLSAFQSLTGSLSMSTSLSSSAMPHKHSRMSASAMSVMAATMTQQEDMMAPISSIAGLDDFTSLLGEAEAKTLVDLLKLAVCGRTGPMSTVQTIAETLILLGAGTPTIGAMLLETCITELEDLCTSRHCLGKVPKPVMQESSHPYVDNVNVTGVVRIPGADMLRLEFDSQCSTEKRNDPLVIMDGAGRVVAMRSGREFSHWAPEIRITGDELRWKFSSDSSVNGWGWRFWVHAIMPASTLSESGSDRAVLSQPSMPLVMALLDARLGPQETGVLLRLAAALATCAQLSALTTAQRIWALKKLHAVLLLEHAPRPHDPTLTAIVVPLIPELLRQYEYEEPQVRGGIHLMHSDYFKTLAALACDMQIDAMLPPGDVHKWAWFKRYCIAVRVAQSLIRRTELPKSFCLEVRKKFAEMLPPVPPSQSPGASLMNSTTSLSSSTTSNVTPPPPPQPSLGHLSQYIDAVIVLRAQEGSASASASLNSSVLNYMLPYNEQLQCLHEDHSLFKEQHDAQLLQWLNRRPDDWALSWGGASTIYGWGHNHRGQLGGLEGSRIKTPTPCEALSLLRPVQLAGGEQSLFAVTPDGKLFATGYGSGGRLGVGGTDSWAIPTLVGSLQHVFIKKVAVNSGGKHCLALTTEGEVYAWGEGEDGKLGHGNRMSYDRPKLVEDLNGMSVADIACGSAHSAAITASGHVLTWGKGRYGRLGHGDSEDQLRPKLVEALLGYRAIDIACGSGDAQTLCITDDDNVWSWGDGDYGKLGRGGSDGCKVPFKIESLAGLGVVKVECGSQFSVALTKSGAVYTWGKGDFHRLGHGSVDHVRRPKKVAALQGKKIISIATGSLHCVACSDSGEVYTWGDNDEGQLGDGTVTAIQRPRLVTALQGKHIVKVTCGSAHTLALSTSQLTERLRPLPNPPLEYDLVRDLPPEALHARLILLHHFSELLCPCLAMLPITGDLSLGALKDVLVYNIKEAAFRKVIQTTMVRDKQHGPVIELNRIQVKRSRNKCNGLAGVDGMKSVFGQMVQKLPLLTQEALSLPHRVWKVKFVGESVDDCGGGYSESIAEMCDELQNGSVPLLINTPNGRGEAGANRDCFLLDPTLTSVLQMNMFRFLGVLMGIAVRTGSPLSLNLAEPVWRQLTGEALRPTDLTEVDRDYVAGLLCIRNMDDDPKVFNTLELPFSTSSARGHEVPLSTRYTHISPKNRAEYVRLALNFRLHEFDEQVKAVRDGMSKVIPVPLLSLFSAVELQAMVCGSPDIPLGLLKSVATYKGFDPNSALVSWFWEVMEEFTNQERSLFLRFVWGRTRLPRTIADFRGRDFVLQVLEKNPPDHFLPESYTCFFLLKMPRYSCKAVLLEKLKYAIHFCKSIDTDEYARVAMGEPTEATGSEDNSDLESVVSHDG